MSLTTQDFVYNCPSCEGGGCDKCEGSGQFKLEQCPRKAIPLYVQEFLDYAELYRKGLAPEHGGTLDQLHSFNVYSRFVWGEQDKYDAELGLMKRG